MFTKTYHAEPNEEQRCGLTRLFKVATVYALSVGENVQVITYTEEDLFKAELHVNGVKIIKATLGSKGKVLGRIWNA